MELYLGLRRSISGKKGRPSQLLRQGRPGDRGAGRIDRHLGVVRRIDEQLIIDCIHRRPGALHGQPGGPAAPRGDVGDSPPMCSPSPSSSRPSSACATSPRTACASRSRSPHAGLAWTSAPGSIAARRPRTRHRTDGRSAGIARNLHLWLDVGVTLGLQNSQLRHARRDYICFGYIIQIIFRIDFSPFERVGTHLELDALIF